MDASKKNGPEDFGPAARPGPFPSGAPVSGPNFAGEVHLALLARTGPPCDAVVANVSFAAGARNSWHEHSAGQLLLVVTGDGLYQVRGEPARRLRPGDSVVVPPGARHWHGASPDAPMSHVAVTPGATIWLEPVAEGDYLAAAAAAAGPAPVG